MEPVFYAASVALAVGTMIAWYTWRDRQRPAPPAPPAPPSRDLIRISQRAAGYPLLWEIEGHRYWSVDEIESDSHRALAIAAVRQLMHQLPPEATTPLPPEGLLEPSTSQQPARTPEMAPSTTPSPAASAPQPPMALADDPAFTQPFWRRLKESILSAPPPPPRIPAISTSALTMLDQIDDLFQENLRQLPAPPEAHVRPAPDGGMQIVVAGRVYHSVGEIPSPAVAEALRQAVKSWEASI